MNQSGLLINLKYILDPSSTKIKVNWYLNSISPAATFKYLKFKEFEFLEIESRKGQKLKDQNNLDYVIKATVDVDQVQKSFYGLARYSDFYKSAIIIPLSFYSKEEEEYFSIVSLQSVLVKIIKFQEQEERILVVENKNLDFQDTFKINYDPKKYLSSIQQIYNIYDMIFILGSKTLNKEGKMTQYLISIDIMLNQATRDSLTYTDLSQGTETQKILQVTLSQNQVTIILQNTNFDLNQIIVKHRCNSTINLVESEESKEILINYQIADNPEEITGNGHLRIIKKPTNENLELKIKQLPKTNDEKWNIDSRSDKSQIKKKQIDILSLISYTGLVTGIEFRTRYDPDIKDIYNLRYGSPKKNIFDDKVRVMAEHTLTPNKQSFCRDNEFVIGNGVGFEERPMSDYKYGYLLDVKSSYDTLHIMYVDTKLTSIKFQSIPKRAPIKNKHLCMIFEGVTSSRKYKIENVMLNQI